jgi:hypothetical protein
MCAERGAQELYIVRLIVENATIHAIENNKLAGNPILQPYLECNSNFSLAALTC